MRTARCSSLLAASLLLSACAGGPEPAPAPEPIAVSDFDPATPAVLGSINGLEMRVWVTEDQDDVLLETIERYEARPTPMLDSVRTAWRASGLRVIEVPLEDLAGFREQLAIVAPEQRDWFGQSPDWSEAIRGREVAAGSVIELADGMMKTPAGRLRVLMRCWTIPGEAVTDPAMHLDLAVQLERRAATQSMLELPALASELEAGVVFPRLRSTMRLSDDAALLIVPMPETIPEPAALEAAGPPEPVTPTLGEAMLSSIAEGTADPVRRRAVIALLPRLPERFTLGAAQRPPAR